MTEESQYNEIFTALKHPVRRQILLFIDSRGEASFTEIQQETGITDTGLMSYHLKELVPLVEQSKRGKYQLSEVGQAGVELFRKVDHERERTNTVIHEEIEQFIGLSVKKSVFFLLITGLTLFAPLLVDIYFSVSIMLNHGYSTFALVMVFLVTLAIMIMGVFLFTLYDGHYYSKNTKNNAIHSFLFALLVSTMSVLFFNQLHTFTQGIGTSQLYGDEIPWLFEILRVAFFIASVPVFVYLLGKSSNGEGKAKRQA